MLLIRESLNCWLNRESLFLRGTIVHTVLMMPVRVGNPRLVFFAKRQYFTLSIGGVH